MENVLPEQQQQADDESVHEQMDLSDPSPPGREHNQQETCTELQNESFPGTDSTILPQVSNQDTTAYTPRSESTFDDFTEPSGLTELSSETARPHSPRPPDAAVQMPEMGSSVQASTVTSRTGLSPPHDILVEPCPHQGYGARVLHAAADLSGLDSRAQDSGDSKMDPTHDPIQHVPTVLHGPLKRPNDSLMLSIRGEHVDAATEEHWRAYTAVEAMHDSVQARRKVSYTPPKVAGWTRRTSSYTSGGNHEPSITPGRSHDMEQIDSAPVVDSVRSSNRRTRSQARIIAKEAMAAARQSSAEPMLSCNVAKASPAVFYSTAPPRLNTRAVPPSLQSTELIEPRARVLRSARTRCAEGLHENNLRPAADSYQRYRYTLFSTKPGDTTTVAARTHVQHSCISPRRLVHPPIRSTVDELAISDWLQFPPSISTIADLARISDVQKRDAVRSGVVHGDRIDKKKTSSLSTQATEDIVLSRQLDPTLFGICPEGDGDV